MTMKGPLTFTAICILAGVFLASPAHSQCPAGINPLQALVGTWTFSTFGSAPAPGPSIPIPPPIASAGKFTASIGPSNQGILSITNTASRNGQITRLETDAGRYQVFPDCSG